MIKPFSEILQQYYPGFKELGYCAVDEQSHSKSFASTHTRIEFSVDQYVPADITMNVVSPNGERYPFWQIRQLMDLQGYSLDKSKLDQIKNHYGLRNGAKGQSLFNSGVKIYAATYIEQALRFLSHYDLLINIDGSAFKKNLTALECEPSLYR